VAGGEARGVTTRVPLTPELLRATERGRFVRIALEGARVVVDDVVARTALVGRPGGGAWRAYANVCRHLAVPLDIGVDSPMAADGVSLLCHQHGARYRPADGYCVDGPCMGASLVAVPIVVDSEALVIG
jgi:nitrite reductase/ring-hydroxylating ferredoxin subunit